SGVAHELNNPLTAILGYAQLLESEELSARVRDFVQKLYKQAQRTHRIVQNLLSFARQRKPQKQHVDLCRVLEDTLALREYDLRLNNIAVEQEFETPLPGVIADGHQLEQVFLNIINNAVDAIQERTKQGKILTRVFAEEDCVCAEVQDSGPGIRDPMRVFDPFYTTKAVGKGTGLGLSICYGIVKEHGGDIVARNVESGGAVFQVRLPAVRNPVVRMEKRRRVSAREVSLQGRILLVDDEEAVLDFVRESLASAGAGVVTAARGEEAMARLQKESFDAVVLDSTLPGAASGIEMYHWVRENHPGMEKNIIMTFSTDVSEGKSRRFIQETGVQRLVKPFEV
ncbi:MAG: hybrid sensor histidine kinase/response regulator, partial [Terriglobales bacterium]